MNNLKSRKGGASLRNLKRLLCLLLVLTMLPINAFASDIIVPGSGGTSPGSGGGGSGTKWSSPTNLGPGMLLHVQSSERTVTFDYTDPANVVSKGYDEVVKYWTTHFPNTDPDSKQTGIYLLPTWIKSNYDQSAIQFKKNGTLDYSYSPVYYIKMGSTTAEINNQLGKNAYNKAAESLKNNSNPNYVLPANYWQNLLNSSTMQSQCASIVTQLFSAKTTSFGYSDGDADAITERVLYYLGEREGENDWSPESTGGKRLTKSQIDVGLFMNYCGFLATVIATLPASERAARAADLDRMCQDFLGGQGYTPMVVTGEIVIPTEYNNDTSWSVWWTPQQALRAVTQQNWPDDMSTMWNPNTGDDIITWIGKRRGYVDKGATTMFGKPTTSGWTQYKGDGFSLPILGNVISSVSQSTIDHYKVNGKPIKGFGVWGLSSTPPAPPIPNPPTPVQITAMGDVGVLVEEKKYQKDVGDYSRRNLCPLDQCICLEERIETGALSLEELLRDCLNSKPKMSLWRRLAQLLYQQSLQFFRTDEHRRRWMHWRTRYHRLSQRNQAALFLLTAYDDIWRRVIWKVEDNGFDFDSVRLAGIQPELYSVYQAAKAISIGSQNITIADLASRELVTDEAFQLIICALLLAKYGNAISNLERKGDS